MSCENKCGEYNYAVVLGARYLMRPLVYQKAPDGGWGWVVAGAFFLVEVFTYGVIKSFGIFLQDLMEEFEESNSRVSWIISICVFVMSFAAPLSSILTNRFGFQPVVMIGGFLLAVGTITTGFTTSVNQMYITTGIIAGLGYCLTFLPTVTILSQYFTRRRSLVTAVASTGESFTMFALAPAFSALRDSIGWRYTMVVIGALQGTIIVCGALLRPIIITHQPVWGTETHVLAPTEQGNQSVQINSKLNSHSRLEDSGSLTRKHSYMAENVNNQENKLTRGDSLRSGVSGGQCLPGTAAGGGSGEEGIPLKGEEEMENLKNQVKVEKVMEGYKLQVEMGKGGIERKGQGDEKEEEEMTSVDQTSQQVRFLDFSVLREGRFICYSLFGLFATLGFFAPQLYIIQLSVNRGVEREHAMYMLSTMAVAEMLGRLSVGWVMSRKQVCHRKPQVLLGCVISLTLVLGAFGLVWEFWGLALCCGLYGFFMGTVASTHIPMLAEEEVVGIERMASAAGVYVFIQSFAGLAGPPLGGLLVDLTQDYGSAFYSCAMGMGLGAVFLGLVLPAKRGLSCNCCRGPQPLHQGLSNPADNHGRDSPQDYLEVDLNQNQEVIHCKGQPITSSA
ncbi:monocarboxylate transporter 7-like isoform X2 [Osmerus eperlanus]|uniref:monocarboxylate transporter 7-like isoform X2 n=1 Tax=Osmerus eperlanus TaxID=29151 RepID=UPI002E147B99